MKGFVEELHTRRDGYVTMLIDCVCVPTTRLSSFVDQKRFR